MKINTDSFQIDGMQNKNSFEKTSDKFSSQGFEDFFKAAISLYDETNAYQLEADKLQMDYITGKNDDIIGLSMAQSRASSSLQFTTQVTNKIISAYQEIMRIQM